MRQSTLAVWEVLLIARAYKGRIAQTAAHLERPAAWVQAAFDYAAAFPAETNAALAQNDAADFEQLQRLLPQIEQCVVPTRNVAR